MSRYRFELATAADDAELRAVLAATPMEGDVRVSFRREPSFFGAARMEGPFHQTIAARDGEHDRIVGFGSRSVRLRYVHGRPTPVGYLSSLRLLPEYRNFGLVARGYGYFRELHGDGRAAMYLTTIAAGNEKALAVLTSGRAGLPRYYEAGKFHSMVVPVGHGRTRPANRYGDIEVRTAQGDDADAIVSFLHQHGPRRQFFPVYDAEDLGSKGTFRGLRPADIILAFRGGRLAGTLGVWDQRPFRQSVVEGYSRRLGWLRPWINATAGLRRLPRLPRPGEVFPFLTGAIPVVERDDPALMDALLRHAAAVAAASDARYLVIGLHERDPLFRAVRRRQVTSYVTHLYHVCWEDGEALRSGLDDRPPYLELGCL